MATMSFYPTTLLLILSLFHVAKAGWEVTFADGSLKQCVPMWTSSQSSQGKSIGAVCLTPAKKDHTVMIVSYQSSYPWGLEHTQLWIGSNLTDMPTLTPMNIDSDTTPTTSHSNSTSSHHHHNNNIPPPNVYEFPYRKKYLAGKSVFGFAVHLPEIGFTCPHEAGATFYVVAHALVTSPTSMSMGGAVHAWAGDSNTDVPVAAAEEEEESIDSIEVNDDKDDGNWMDFTFTLKCHVVAEKERVEKGRHFANLIPQ